MSTAENLARGRTPTLIADDVKVKRMARAAGVWPLLRKAHRDGRPCLVVRGLTAYAAFEDGFAAVVCGELADLVELMTVMCALLQIEAANIQKLWTIH
ncbi:hypothetical protein [Methylococcus sp. EFPC2]|uniref:hypothetical protein n=1 Tax=Methylococcus sp. EFPC2 TaxID=2812648 RepID=UPI0019678581|nr:hypothetical protein [Methylococcus sp. EFPC2]QSA98728.1 hypothetical protein JWZ97_08075 [Methylococcus sp. EFPC2]